MKHIKSYRLTSLEEPTDEQLAAVMAYVGEIARDSTRKAKEALDAKMEELRKFAEDYAKSQK